MRRVARQLLACLRCVNARSRGITHRRMQTHKGDRVSVTVSSVYLAGPEEPISGMPGSTELEGTVIGFSDSGSGIATFAVVEVLRKQTVIVRVEDLHPLTATKAENG